jgi:hypothetical protein
MRFPVTDENFEPHRENIAVDFFKGCEDKLERWQVIHLSHFILITIRHQIAQIAMWRAAGEWRTPS